MMLCFVLWCNTYLHHHHHHHHPMTNPNPPHDPPTCLPVQSVVLRYGKFQSTAGVEDETRVPQGKMMKWAPGVMDFVVNLNRYERRKEEMIEEEREGSIFFVSF